MKKWGWYLSVIFLTLIVSLSVSKTTNAQQIWLDQEMGNNFTVEYLKPSIDNFFFEYSFLSSAWFFSGQFQTSDRTHLIIDIPFSYAKMGESQFFQDADPDSETMIGNPYIGIKHFTEKNILEFGVRLPLASEGKPNAADIGILSDFDRLEAFFAAGFDILTISGKIHSMRELSDVFNLRWTYGSTIWIPLEERDFVDDEVFFDYALIGELSQESFGLKAGIIGSAIITENPDDFSDRFIHQFGINASYLTGNLQPGIHLRTPIQGDLKELINHVIGLNVMYRF